MDQGFFHFQRGYWQAVGGVPTEVRAAYPEGTIEVPLKPGADFEWINGVWEPVTPPPAPVPKELSFVQFLVGLTEQGWITEPEYHQWLSGSSLPVSVEDVISQLPETGPSGEKPQLRAKVRALRPSNVVRNNELLLAMAAARGATAEQLDDFFRVYSQI